MAQDQRQRRRDGSRRAQASRQRRQDARGQRKKQKYVYGGAGAVVVAVVIALVVLLQGGGADLGYSVRTLGGVHSPPYEYTLDVVINGDPERVPPTSGNHMPQLSPYGFLGDTLIPEAVVHNMEHGSVVIWYQPDNPEIAAQVNQLVRGLGSQCIVAGSYADMSFAITATVWGRVLPLDTFDESQLRSFVNEYRGDEGPESGLCRQQS